MSSAALNSEVNVVPGLHLVQTWDAFGACLKRAREAVGLERKELAQLIGVTGCAIYRWESSIDSPVLPNYEALLDLFPSLKDAPTPDCQDRVKPDGGEGQPRNNARAVKARKPAPVAAPEPVQVSTPVPAPEPVIEAPSAKETAAVESPLNVALVRWSQLIQQESFSKADVKELLILTTTLGLSQTDVVDCFE